MTKYYLPWPDRVGIGAVLLLVVLVGTLVLFAHSPPAQEGESVAVETLKLVLGTFSFGFFFGIPIWLIAKIIDFMLGGPWNRKRQRQYRE